MTDGTDNRPTVIRAGHGYPELTVLSGPESGRLVVLDRLPCVLGRGGASHVALVDPDDPPALSREHATLTPADRGLMVTDHSTNGTWVGDGRVPRGETRLLGPGVHLRLGPTLLLRVGSPIAMQPALPEDWPHRASGQSPATAKGAIRHLVANAAALEAAWHRVELNRGGAGIDNVTVRDFGKDLGRRLDGLRRDLASGRYEPSPARLFAAPKRSGGVRTISILTVRDRLVQHALHTAMLPLLEPGFADCSHAYRPGRSAHSALAAVDGLLAQGLHWIAETDIASFFDTVSHAILLAKLDAALGDAYALTLVARCLAAWATAPGAGVPQGAATSPLFANLYLDEFDRYLLGIALHPVRYADDLVVCCGTRGEAERAVADSEGFLRSRLQLALRPDKTRVVPLAAGFAFMGFRFTAAGREPAPEALARIKDRLSEASPDQIGAVARGWSGYFGRPAPDMPGQDAAVPNLTAGTEPVGDIAEALLRVAAGREDVYARLAAHGRRVRLTPCSGPLTLDLIGEHLRGEASLAVYVLRSDGRVCFAVIDVDETVEDGQQRATVALGWALALAATCRRHGVPCMLEESGRKGAHVWIRFDEPVEAESARRMARLLAVSAGATPEGVRVEVFPRHSEWPGPELGDAVKLPCGLHPVTGRRCAILDETGRPVDDTLSALHSCRVVKSGTLEALLRTLAGPAAAVAPKARTAATDETRRLIAGCGVLRQIVRRAAETGHLRHTHRLIVLYTAGRLGSGGATEVHTVMALCRNYDPRRTQSHLDRLDAGKRPISCATIREWLDEDGVGDWCDCAEPPGTPLDLLGAACSPTPGRRGMPRTQAGPRAAAQPPAADAWDEVASDLFGGDDSAEDDEA
jgi:group II intron reverse transcriptase/maturase